MSEIRQWLRQLGLGQYAAVFTGQQINRDVFRELTDENREKLGIPGSPQQLLKTIATFEIREYDSTSDRSH